MHPAHCGVHIFRKAIQLMRAKNFLNAVQRAGEHRRVLGGRITLFSFREMIINFQNIKNHGKNQIKF